jgi:glucose/mannose-6-phosphate isomerase
MNLDDLSLIQKLDTLNMLGEINSLPTQLENAWILGQSLPLPVMEGIQKVILSGMGGSAIGADLVSAYVAPTCPVPVVVHRDYGLPAWASGPGTLMVASSHSGETEETLDSFDAGAKSGCRVIAICTGGELEKRALAARIPVWKFSHAGQPRAAVGWSFGLLLSLFSRLGLIPDPSQELAAAILGMRSRQPILAAAIPSAGNPAKRLAGLLVDRWVNVFGSGILAPVARRWKDQLNELAKTGAGFEFLPEADHNALAALVNPEMLGKVITLFLSSPSDHPRNQKRTTLTHKAFLAAGMNTDLFTAIGDSPLEQMWTTLHFGDYLGFYLAIAYGMDPTPVEALQGFKRALRSGE